MNTNNLDIALESKELRQFLKDALINGFMVQSGFDQIMLHRPSTGTLPDCKINIEMRILDTYNPVKNGYKADIFINQNHVETVKIKGISIAEILLKNRVKK